MQMHPYFTEIPLRSFDAMAFEGNLSEVLLALIVDPDEAADLALTIQDIQATRIEIVFDGKIIDAPITLSDFQNLPSKNAFEQLRITLAQWVMTTDRADIAVKTLTIWDRRFGVWCTCAVAREALRFVPEDELRPLWAIETVEAWVRGMATAAQVSASADAAADASDAYAYAAANDAVRGTSRARARAAAAAARAAAAAADAAAYAAYAADAAARAAYAADAAARAAANAADADAEYDAEYDAELARLREVVANACLTFPG